MKIVSGAQIAIFLLFAGGVIYIFNTNGSPKVQVAADSPPPVPNSPIAETQLLEASYGPPFGFYPTEFRVKAGQGVRLEVRATENGRGCMGSITIPDFSREIQVFVKGQTNVFEFTPTTPGQYPITCAMGIPHATIIVE